MGVFQGNRSIYKYEITDILGENIKNWIQYGLLELGAYTAVKFNLPTSGLTTLKKVYDERYGGNGRVYEGTGPSWVWESGVAVIPTGLQPIFQVSGVYVDNVFYSTAATTSGAYKHFVDYRNGRVIFDSVVSGTVKCEYVFRDVDVFLTESPKWKTVIEQYDKLYDNLESMSPSGMAAILKHNRVWLPAVAIDISEIRNEPLQLGGGHLAECDVTYYILGNTPFIALRLADTLNSQKDQTLNLYDINRAPFPYNYNGSLASGIKTYPELANQNSGYFWTFGAIISSIALPEPSDTDVHLCHVTQTFEVPRYLSTY